MSESIGQVLEGFPITDQSDELSALSQWVSQLEGLTDRLCNSKLLT